MIAPAMSRARRLDGAIAYRVQLAYRVEPASLARRLPPGWEPAEVPRGPSRGANLLLIFNDVLLNELGRGQPAPNATDRFLGLVTIGRQEGETANFNFRIYACNPGSIPGKYRTALPARVSREHRLRGEGLETVVEERWRVQPETGGLIRLELECRPGVPVRSGFSGDVRSAADPSLVRRYRTDQLLALVYSVPQEVDLTARLALGVEGVEELSDLWQGSERLLSASLVPWYWREVFPAR